VLLFGEQRRCRNPSKSPQDLQRAALLSPTIHRYRAALKINREEDGAIGGLGDLLEARGDTAAAAKVYLGIPSLEVRESSNEVRICALTPTKCHVEALWRLGRVYQGRGDLAGAAEILRVATTLNPS